MADDEFEWRPGRPKRNSGPVVAVAMLAACAGAALSWVLPIEKLVVAIERNGVPPPPHSESTDIATAPSGATAPNGLLAPPVAAPSGTAQPEQAPKVVVINPGTARAAAPEMPNPRLQGAKVMQPPPGSIAGLAEPKPALPPSARHRNTSDRPVLVVVRRKGPPYDTKVLRGRISNGRLIVDSRDRRGLVIR
jgi:hypothetical protein